ncbi:MAG: T9SS type A sorting domain-containing protein [Gelidibacter sp.]
MKTNITLFSILMVTMQMVSQVAFQHCAVVVTGSRTILDHPSINNQPDLVLAVEKLRVEDKGTIYRNPYAIAVGYDVAMGKHYIQNENAAMPFPENTCYNILAVPRDSAGNINGNFTHTATEASIPDTTPYQTEIDYSVINDNALIRCLWSRFFGGVANDQPYDLYYDYLTPGQWLLLTASNLVVFPNAQFNILCDLLAISIITQVESTTENTTNNVVAIDDFEYFMELDIPMINNNPNAIIFAQHRREPSTAFVLRSDSVFYDVTSGRWQVHIELENYISGFTFPIGRFYDIYILDESLSVPEVLASDAIKVYPNPIDQLVSFEASQQISKISIYSMLGQKIEEFVGNGSNSLQMDMSAYSTGNYIAKVQLGDISKIVKLLKD